MTKKMIKPSRAGLLVRKADGSPLAADGETLPVNAYWLRREKEGDVNITEPPKSRTPKTDKEA